MSILSRRSLVTSAAALPALAVSALASDAIGPNHPDAELLRLGSELEALIVDWHAQQRTDAARRELRGAVCVKAGLPRIKYGSIPDDEYDAYEEKREAVLGSLSSWADPDTNEHGKSMAWNNIHDRQFPLIDAIMALKPHTLAGLAVIARAFTLFHSEQWEPAINSDDPQHRRAFMESVCAVVGVVPVPAEAVQS